MITLNAAIKFDGRWFVARCLELPVTSQGTTVEQAKVNLAEAIELHFETWGVDELDASVGELELVKVNVMAPPRREDSALEALSDLVGCMDHAESGLATNLIYMEGFGT